MRDESWTPVQYIVMYQGDRMDNDKGYVGLRVLRGYDLIESLILRVRAVGYGEEIVSAWGKK